MMSAKLWLWRNGPREFWAFEHCYPIYMDRDDPQTIGEPAGYAIIKQSRSGRLADEKTPEQYAYFLQGKAPSELQIAAQRLALYCDECALILKATHLGKAQSLEFKAADVLRAINREI